MIDVLESHFPNWRTLSIHESSPHGPASEMLKRECKEYIATRYYPDVPMGESFHGYRCENLENQTFANCSFDLVVTQDVFEHVLHPDWAFREVARTLKENGAHVFTVPWYYWKKTVIRAQEKQGKIEHILLPDYHGNPISKDGSLVVREWGYDMLDYIRQCSGMFTVAIHTNNARMGIEAKFIEVFISRKVN
jgi:SAM-dependent methyltransferase